MAPDRPHSGSAADACQGCGGAILPGAAFCAHCGTAVGPRCTGCGRTLPDAASFCPYCGAPNASATVATAALSHGERRNATVLFSDLSGYTTLNQVLDPEEVAEVMNRLKTDVTRIIQSQGGTVNQFVGDEVMALFGIPRAHDDDPLRAVRAAIELHDSVRALGDELAPRVGMSLRLHTAINTGLMISQLRDRRDGLYGVTGDSINTAARLASEASDDEILIGPTTYSAVRSRVATEWVGSLNLRGRSGALDAYRVEGDLGADDAASLEAEDAGEFVGRDGELKTMMRCFGECRAGTGRLVGIAGEPGVGKTRLVTEFAQSLPADAMVLHGECPSFGSVAPYQPFREVLREAFVAELGGDLDTQRVVEHVERNLPDCVEHLPAILTLLSLRSDTHTLPPGSADRSQEALLAGLDRVFMALAQERPLVLVLSDWHWSDPASEQALHHLAQDLPGKRLLMLVSFRTYYTPHWEDRALRLDLPALAASQTRSIARRILGEDASDALASRVFERTGGNPLFVEQLCTALSDLQAMSGANPEQAVEELVPDDVASVLRARIDRLPTGSIELLKLASVLGESFPVALLRDLHEADDEFDEAYAGLSGAELLRPPDDQGTVHFKHALVRDVAYEMLLLSRRRKLHGAAGTAIERRESEQIHVHLERLAHHFSRSDEHDKAVFYLDLSADKAATSGAMVQALRLYIDAVRILAQLPETPDQMRLRVDLTLKLSDAAIYRPSKDLRDLLDTALELAERLGDERAMRRILSGLGWLENALGEWDAATRHFHRGIALAEEHQDGTLLSLLYANLGQTHYHGGNYEAATDCMKRGIDLIRSIRGPRTASPMISYSLGYMAMIDADAGNFERAFRRLDEAEALNRKTGIVPFEAALTSIRCAVLLFRGDWSDCQAQGEELDRKAKRIGSIYMQAMSLCNGGYARCLSGMSREGTTMLRDGVALLVGEGIHMNVSFLYGCLAEARAMGSDFGEAEELAERALEHAARGDRMGEPTAYRVQLMVAMERAGGSREPVEAALDAAVGAATRRGSPREAAIARFRAAEGMQSWQPDWARELAHDCSRRFRAMDMPWYAARADALGG